MKKTYETPSVEIVKFQYRDQVVVASAGCGTVYENAQINKNECETESVPVRRNFN